MVPRQAVASLFLSIYTVGLRGAGFVGRMLMAQIRYEVYYSGRVQGVGFRWTAQRSARGFEVTGFVRNLNDGQVEIIVEGSRSELDRYLADVSRAMGAKIDNERRKEVPPTGEYDDFSIRY